MIEYLDCVISESIELPDGGSEISRPPTRDFEDDAAYENALREYGNAVASKRQIHSKSHNSTCFKNKTRKRECRFGFPRPTVEKSIIDELGVAHLRRDNEWVTPYNPCIAAAIGSNQDLSFMGTKAKALALVYYITNYATKDEASTYQMVMAAALIRKILDEQDPATIPPTEERPTGCRNFHFVSSIEWLTTERSVEFRWLAPSYSYLHVTRQKRNSFELTYTIFDGGFLSIFRGSYHDDGRDEEHVTLRRRANSKVRVLMTTDIGVRRYKTCASMNTSRSFRNDLPQIGLAVISTSLSTTLSTVKRLRLFVHLTFHQELLLYQASYQNNKALKIASREVIRRH